ncbi:MAG: LamG domain-containing protein [Candidatus Poribacteria bacterium]
MKARFLLIGLVVLFVGGMLANSAHAAIDPKTIVGLWLFDEGSGNIATDTSGNKNNGNFTGSPKWVAGKFGKALQLDGSSASVDCGNTASLDIPTNNAVTMVAWVNSAVGSLASWQGLMAKRSGNYSYGINFVTGNFQVYSSSASGVQGWGYNLPKGEWTHLVGIMSKSPTELYVNGELNGGAGKGPGGGALSNTANLFRIGASGSIGEYFNGIVDDVAVFNVALSAADIKNIFSKGLAVATGKAAVESSGKLATSWASLKSQ